MELDANSIESLNSLRKNDLFGPDGFLYTGVQDEGQKLSLSQRFDEVLCNFIGACEEGAAPEKMLELLKSTLSQFDRVSLDTEDAENLAGNFEKIMDCIGLESSDGSLNDWMYGFDLS